MHSIIALPVFTDDAVIEIQAGRHPVVENQVENFIANDVRLGDCGDAQRQMLVITGPNMGGKSTYMRQIALIALLAHCGSFVPAKAHASARSIRSLPVSARPMILPADVRRSCWK